MRVCLFEDGAATLEPLSLTRPVFDLRCGLTTLAEKHLRLLAPWSVGVLIRPPGSKQRNLRTHGYDHFA